MTIEQGIQKIDDLIKEISRCSPNICLELLGEMNNRAADAFNSFQDGNENFDIGVEENIDDEDDDDEDEESDIPY